MGIHHAMEPAFLTTAGEAAEGWLFSALFTDPQAVPAAAGFVAAHRAAYGQPPARWATEAYDAVGLVADALTGLGEDGRGRAGLTRRIFRTAHQGLAKPLSFDTNTHVLKRGQRLPLPGRIRRVPVPGPLPGREAVGRAVTGPRGDRPRRDYSNREVSPAPRRTISTSPPEKSMTVVGSVPQSPESSTASTSWSSRSLISQP